MGRNNYDSVQANHFDWYLSPYVLKESQYAQDLRTLEKLKNSILETAQIELTKQCNFNCTMCPRDDLAEEIKNQHMTFDTFVSVLSSLPSTIKTIIVNGLGESSLNPEFKKILQYAKKKNYRVIHYTNGSVFNPENLRFIDQIFFSLDGVDYDTLVMIRKNIKPNHVLEKISQARKYIDCHRLQTKLSVNITCSRQNYLDIKNVFEFCQAVGVELVQIQPRSNNYLASSEKFLKMHNVMQEDLGVDWGFVCNAYSDKYDFNLVIFYPKKKMIGHCYWLFKEVYINSNAEVIRCCRQVTKPTVFGSLLQKPFSEIWSSKGIELHQIAHLTGGEVYPCVDCTTGIIL